MITVQEIAARMKEQLENNGFKPLSEMKPGDVKNGDVVLLFNTATTDVEIVLARSAEEGNEGVKFYYTHKTSATTWSDTMVDTKFLRCFIYKVIA